MAFQATAVNVSTGRWLRNGNEGMVQFKVLGTLEVLNGERICTPTPPKVRRVLSVLVMTANRIVHMDALIDELWGANPPKSAVTTVQTYICHLRRVFEKENLCTTHGDLLYTRPPGYVLRVSDDQLDARLFEQLTARGQELLERGCAHQASEVLRRALAMWTGPALANIQPGDVLQPYVVHLEERRISALELRIQADMALGRHRQIICELRSLVATFPLNEWFHEQLITALSHSGRRSEALQAYQHVRAVLNEELGVEPSPDLQRLQHDVLSLGIAAVPRARTA